MSQGKKTVSNLTIAAIIVAIIIGFALPATLLAQATEAELKAKEVELLKKELELLRKEKAMQGEKSSTVSKPVPTAAPVQPVKQNPLYEKPYQAEESASSGDATDKSHFAAMLGPGFTLKSAVAGAGTAVYFYGGFEVGGASSLFFFNAIVVGGGTMLSLGPKFNFPISLMDNLYIYPSFAFGPAFIFSGGTKTITGGIRPGFGAAYVLDDLLILIFEPFSMDIGFGGYTFGTSGGGYRATTINYQILFGAGLVW